MYESRAIGSLGHHSGQVITTSVPSHLTYGLEMCDHDPYTLLLLIRLSGGPLYCGLDAFILDHIQIG